MSLLSNTAILLGKELRTEFRSRELLTTTAVFILIVLVLFSFAINPGTEEARQFAPGLLWLAILFAASLMFQSCFLREQTNDTLSSLRLAVSDPFAIFLATLIAACGNCCCRCFCCRCSPRCWWSALSSREVFWIAIRSCSGRA